MVALRHPPCLKPVSAGSGQKRERMKRFEPLVQNLSDPEQAHLLTLLLDDCYQKNLNPTAFRPGGCAAQGRRITRARLHPPPGRQASP